MHNFLERIIGATLLDADSYEEVEADRSANVQALSVVVLSSVAAGIGVSARQDDAPFAFFAQIVVMSLLAWVSWAAVMYMVGAFILPTKDTRTDMGEMLRTLGFAASPGLFQVFALIPGLRIGVFALCVLWTLVATVVAVRQALDFTSTLRAVAVCGLGWALSLAMVVLLGLAFGPHLLGGWNV
jgi:hypothetical protein